MILIHVIYFSSSKVSNSNMTKKWIIIERKSQDKLQEMANSNITNDDSNDLKNNSISTIVYVFPYKLFKNTNLSTVYFI